MNPTSHTISAKGQSLGRLATRVAMLLRGKTTPDFSPERMPQVKVKITDVSMLNLPAKRLSSLTYLQYSGYPGGLRAERAEEVIVKKGHGELLRRAVAGMLPKNKLRPRMLKNLTIQ